MSVLYRFAVGALLPDEDALDTFYSELGASDEWIYNERTGYYGTEVEAHAAQNPLSGSGMRVWHMEDGQVAVVYILPDREMPWDAGAFTWSEMLSQFVAWGERTAEGMAAWSTCPEHVRSLLGEPQLLVIDWR